MLSARGVMGALICESDYDCQHALSYFLGAAAFILRIRRRALLLRCLGQLMAREGSAGELGCALGSCRGAGLPSLTRVGARCERGALL